MSHSNATPLRRTPITPRCVTLCAGLPSSLCLSPEEHQRSHMYHAPNHCYPGCSGSSEHSACSLALTLPWATRDAARSAPSDSFSSLSSVLMRCLSSSDSVRSLRPLPFDMPPKVLRLDFERHSDTCRRRPCLHLLRGQRAHRACSSSPCEWLCHAQDPPCHPQWSAFCHLCTWPASYRDACTSSLRRSRGTPGLAPEQARNPEAHHQ